MLQKFGLETNRDYSGKGIIVVHKNGEELVLVRTTTKMLMCEGDKKERRMRLDSLTDVKYPENYSIKEKSEKVEDSSSDKINIDDWWSEDGGFFDSDFAMASNPHFVFDNDTMYM
jgi:hypothetical protein